MNRIKVIEYLYLIKDTSSYNPDIYIIKRYLEGLFKSNKFPLKIDDFNSLQRILIYKGTYNTKILHIIEYD